MIKVGDVLYNSVTGTRAQILDLRNDGFIIEQTIEPGKKASSLNHLHQSWTEHFEIMNGKGRYMT
jgi:uncharacterized cupin superfamily protein